MHVTPCVFLNTESPSYPIHYSLSILPPPSLFLDWLWEARFLSTLMSNSGPPSTLVSNSSCPTKPTFLYPEAHQVFDRLNSFKKEAVVWNDIFSTGLYSRLGRVWNTCLWGPRVLVREAHVPTTPPQGAVWIRLRKCPKGCMLPQVLILTVRILSSAHSFKPPTSLWRYSFIRRDREQGDQNSRFVYKGARLVPSSLSLI